MEFKPRERLPTVGAIDNRECARYEGAAIGDWMLSLPPHQCAPIRKSQRAKSPSGRIRSTHDARRVREKCEVGTGLRDVLVSLSCTTDLAGAVAERWNRCSCSGEERARLTESAWATFSGLDLDVPRMLPLDSRTQFASMSSSSRRFAEHACVRSCQRPTKSSLQHHEVPRLRKEFSKGGDPP